MCMVWPVRYEPAGPTIARTMPAISNGRARDQRDLPGELVALVHPRFSHFSSFAIDGGSLRH